MKIITQKISYPLLKEKEIQLFIKRIDLIHPFISGNKYYKLKYNLLEAEKQKKNTILTFGGAYSNHIEATAFEAKEKGFKSIGIIRGEETFPLNDTLSFAKENGMQIHYVSREEYRKKQTESFIAKLKDMFGSFYLIPEGGTNIFAIKGTSEILEEEDYDFVCCAIGTGGTISGIINSANNNQKILGFSAIKGSWDLKKDITNWTTNENWQLIEDYNFGGFAKISDELISFITDFYKTQNIPLDAIYTGKMLFGLFDMINKDYFRKGSSILAIPTGGLQGNRGMNERFRLNLPHNL
ncbi:MAG: 1-aminocyclopropane-1-carboxylate deaminase/D-cysteine desulfhydrase [Flavobacteriales bacterium]|nr:1-aminocyclopropane-1-carboxylate deaminase/D-cysteine desulfhydrase [Flavobacteriales bacterium]